MVIVSDGKTDYKILIPHAASEAVLYAAHQLQEYVERATGSRLQIWRDTHLHALAKEGAWSPIPARAWRGPWLDKLIPSKFISLGRTKLFDAQNLNNDYNALNGDGFYLQTRGEQVFVTAKNDRGILYGVCEILERCLGIRFLTERDTWLPRNAVMEIPEWDEACVPAFAMRTYLVGGVFQDSCEPAHYVHTRTNDSFTHMDARHGGRSSMWGRNVDHNFIFYVPREVYGESHPEFYYTDATYGTTIDLLNGITPDGKLDESMDVSVAKIVIEEMKKDVLANPDIDFFVFEQEDGPFCYPYDDHPEKLAIEQKYKRSGILIRFCNVLAEALQKWSDAELGGRKINIVTFAYSYASEAPVREENGEYFPIDETVVARDNVVMRIALMSNAYYSYFDPRQPDYLRDGLAQWKACAKRFMFWAYDNNFCQYLCYYPSFRVMQENMRGFRDMGITYFCMQGPHNTCVNWQGNMRAYVYRNLMWDPDRDAQALLDEYIDKYYGMAAPRIRAFMEHFERWYREYSADNELDVRMVVGNHYKPECNRIEVIDAAEAEIVRAEEEVRASALGEAEKADLLKKLLRVKATPQYMRFNHYEDFYPDRGQQDKDAYAEVLFDTCRRADIDFYAETMMFEEYTIERKL